MGKMECVEAIYDVLRGSGLDDGEDTFDDILEACAAVAYGEGGFTEPLSWIAAGSKRSPATVGRELIQYAQQSGCVKGISEIISTAVAAGMAALDMEVEL